jgi:predicted acetyltransferase
MIVRKIKESELLRANQIASVAFEWPFGPVSSVVEKNESKEKATMKSRGDLYEQNRWAAFDDAGEMLGSIGVIPYQIAFDGHTVGMSGIGGVSTLPPYRRKGMIRACFEHAFAEMREQKQLFSALYPFSVMYYRKFGYEIATEVAEWTIDFSAIPDYADVGGSYSMYSPGDDLSDYLMVYRAFSKYYTFAIDREICDMVPFTSNPYEKFQFLYLFRNDAGEPKGYLSFYHETADNKSIINCVTPFHGVEFCFSDIEGLKGLLCFVRKFAPKYDTLKITLPKDFPLQLYLGETNDVKREMLFRGMVRVVDAEQVLRIAQYQGNGAFSIRIDDPCAPWNQDCFDVKFEAGRAVSIERGGKSPDIAMSIGDFSRLITGCRNEAPLSQFPSVVIYHNNPVFDQVFYSKPNWFGDFF